MAKLTSEKAREILRHREVKDKPLSSKQKRFFGLIAGGGKPRLSRLAKKLRKK